MKSWYRKKIHSLNAYRLNRANAIIKYCLDKDIHDELILRAAIILYNLMLFRAHSLSYEPTRNHYIPVFLLRNFAIGSSGNIHEYSYLRRPTAVSIKKQAACITDLYTTKDKTSQGPSDFIEKHLFALKLEKFAAIPIKKLTERGLYEMSALENSILCSFVGFQYTRTPWFLEDIRCVLEYLNLVKGVSIEAMAEPKFAERAFIENQFKLDQIQVRKFTLKNTMRMGGAGPLILSMAVQLGDRLGQLIYQRNVGLLEATSPAYFYLSDNPCCIRNSQRRRPVGPFLWELQNAPVIFLPLTPQKCLYLIRPDLSLPSSVLGQFAHSSLRSSIREYAYSDRVSDELSRHFELPPDVQQKLRSNNSKQLTVNKVTG
jgi:hypothetical protein